MCVRMFQIKTSHAHVYVCPRCHPGCSVVILQTNRHLSKTICGSNTQLRLQCLLAAAPWSGLGSSAIDGLDMITLLPPPAPPFCRRYVRFMHTYRHTNGRNCEKIDDSLLTDRHRNCGTRNKGGPYKQGSRYMQKMHA